MYTRKSKSWQPKLVMRSASALPQSHKRALTDVSDIAGEAGHGAKNASPVVPLATMTTMVMSMY